MGGALSVEKDHFESPNPKRKNQRPYKLQICPDHPNDQKI